MYERFLRHRRRGVSVLAALVLIAVLGVAAAAMQYVSHSSAIAFAPESQGAAANAATPSQSQPNQCPIQSQADQDAKSGGGGTSTTCLPGQVHKIDMSGGTNSVQQDQVSDCLVQQTNAQGQPVTNTQGQVQCIKNPNETSNKDCALAQPTQCVVEYCPPSGVLSASGGCFVVKNCSAGDSSCVSNLTSGYLQNEAPTTVAALALANNSQTAVLPATGQVNGSQYLTQALNNAPTGESETFAPAAQQTVADQLQQWAQQPGQTQGTLSTLSSDVTNGTAPCSLEGNCDPASQFNALNNDLANTSGSPAATTPAPPGTTLASGGAITSPPGSTPPSNPSGTLAQGGISQPTQTGVNTDVGNPAASLGCSSNPNQFGCPGYVVPANNSTLGGGDQGGGGGTPPPANNNTNALNCGVGFSLTGGSTGGVGYNCNVGSGSNSGLNNLLEMSMMAKLIQGMVNSGNTSVPPGNTTPYAAGTCNTQYTCSGNVVYYQQNTCVQSYYQSCQYGCNAGGAACASQPPYGVGTDGNACAAPVTQPAASSCTGGTWQPVAAQNQCPDASWQCVGGNQSSDNGTFTVTAGSNGNPLTVDINFTSGVACDDGFEVTWGDGDQPNVMTYAPSSSCSGGTQTNAIPHTYAAAGTYTITLAEGTSLSQSTSQQVTVPLSNNGNPTAALTCSQPIADVGENVSLGYQCTNASTASGSGFQTGGNLSGTTTVAISTPPSGSNTATYTLTCTGASGQTQGAQCSVQVNQPSIVLVANPNSVASGGSTSVGWVTTGMKSCSISDSPDMGGFNAANASDTSPSGATVLSDVTGSVTLTLNCDTLGGQTKTATTLVQVGSGSTTNQPVSVSTSADGGSTSHGSSVSVQWNSTNAPSGSAMSLWLVDEQTNTADSLIAGDLATSGSVTWNIPAVGSSCTANAANVCASDLVAGDSYAVEAVLYSPSNAYIGDGVAPANPIQPTYGASAVGGTFTISQ